MARRRIETFEYRQALVRLQAGDSEREIARSRVVGRDKLARFRALAAAKGRLVYRDLGAGNPARFN